MALEEFSQSELPLSDLTPHSCPSCENLVFAFANDVPAEGHFYLGELGRRFFMFNISADNAAQASERGCAFFKCITNDLSGGRLRAGFSDYSSGTTEVYFEWVDKEDESLLGGDAMIICALEGDPAAREFSTNLPNPHPSSHLSFQLIRNWLQECIVNHENCLKPTASWPMPRRLIRIDGSVDEPTLKLLERFESSKYIPYAALSYCWGANQSFVLTKEVREEWLNGIAWVRLPQTLKDAIRVVQQLRIQFLWVDALCIIQNDEMDKALEVSRMDDVYGRAYITIAASRARDAKQGFLLPRRVTHNLEKVFRLPYRCRDGKLGSVILFKSPGVGWVEPIEERAWTLQENLLSCRVLEYGALQTRWQCETASYGRQYVDGWMSFKLCYATVTSIWKDLGISSQAKHSTSALQLFGDGENNKCRMWRYLVEAYTKRDLSRCTDRLLALSGIAKKFSAFTESEYVAGLWRAFLPSHLLWYTYKEWRSPVSRCPVEYIAPSWSWASIEGSIHFRAMTLNPNSLRAEVLEVKVNHASPKNPYGAVVGGFLSIQARVRSAILVIRSEKLLDPESNSLVSAWIKIDVVMDKSKDWLAVVLLELSECDPVYQDLSGGLILCRAGTLTFRRIGIFELEPSKENKQKWYEYGEAYDANKHYLLSPRFDTPNWFDGCQRRTITII